MAVVRVRAAIRLDDRRAHELRSLAAMAQANGGCDAVLPSSGMVSSAVPNSCVELSNFMNFTQNLGTQTMAQAGGGGG
jgi:hypothetical protein